MKIVTCLGIYLDNCRVPRRITRAEITNLKLVVSGAFSFYQYYLVKTTKNLPEITYFFLVLTKYGSNKMDSV